MQKIKTYKEYIMGALIAFSFLAYYYDIFGDEMMVSGVIALVVATYISVLWSEEKYDERDEYIRSKVDRMLYILTVVLLLGIIIYKTFIHVGYMYELSLLSALSVAKILLSKFVKENS